MKTLYGPWIPGSFKWQHTIVYHRWRKAKPVKLWSASVSLVRDTLSIVIAVPLWVHRVYTSAKLTIYIKPLGFGMNVEMESMARLRWHCEALKYILALVKRQQAQHILCWCQCALHPAIAFGCTSCLLRMGGRQHCRPEMFGLLPTTETQRSSIHLY